MIQTPENKPERLLRARQVCERLSISRSSWYQGIRDGRFDEGWKLGPRTRAWPERYIDKIVLEGVQE